MLNYSCLVSKVEDIFELAENYGEYYGKVYGGLSGRDPHDRLGGRPGQIRNPPALINTIMQLNLVNTYSTVQPTAQAPSNPSPTLSPYTSFHFGNAAA
jgi:hypothetical protein